MTRSQIVLICLLYLSDGVFYDAVEIPPPKITRKYKPCTGGKSSQNCLVECSLFDAAPALLSWYNGSDPLYNLTVSPHNTRLYLEVDCQDQNSYFNCTVSSSGVNQTTHLDKNLICQPCPETTMMPVSEGGSVTLSTHLKERHNEDIEWVYEENYLIAELHGQNDDYHFCDDGRFRDRLQLDLKTGSLTIKNISQIHSGTYEPKITDDSVMARQCLSYNVTVYDPLPLPVITKNSTRCSSSSKCVVMCSVNVTRVTLSWYNGSRLNSSISVSDLKSNFLCLEVKYQDTNTYRCVVNNSFVNITTQLNIGEFCKDQGKYLGYLGFLGLIILCPICYCLYKCQKDASRGQHPVTYTVALGNAGTSGGHQGTSGGHQETSGTAAQENDASGQGTSGNDAIEKTSLIVRPSSSQESVSSNTLCCSKSQ
ncbi:uncharacterized protein LOC130548590 isoform X2 [Triplophysa rosa]|uniref:uncharacterized protein LOC130548590 isoform X2 n=1 Tax=Triplophysa rosa TaxID=992332 RepID=UPI002545DC82|nr:uncharacterized protein LOC130548590 isoform X2 [Triplophysa rosa]